MNNIPSRKPKKCYAFFDNCTTINKAVSYTDVEIASNGGSIAAYFDMHRLIPVIMPTEKAKHYIKKEIEEHAKENNQYKIVSLDNLEDTLTKLGEYKSHELVAIHLNRDGFKVSKCDGRYTTFEESYNGLQRVIISEDLFFELVENPRAN